MIYNDLVNENYENSLRDHGSNVTVCIQPLDHWENALGEYRAEIVGSESSLTVNKGNGCRRSLTLSLLDRNGAFTPSKNSDIWYNRKIKLIAEYRTSETSGTRWRFSQGVFICSSCSVQNGIVKLSGVDKYANLNGESRIGTVSVPFTTDISAGTIYVADLIRETLLRDMGNGLPLDPMTPLIDPYYYTEPLYADIALSVGQHYGDIITKLAEMYGADCYYDASGRLVFRRKPTYSRPEWYMHLGYIYRYKDRDETVQQGSEVSTHAFDGVNCVTVATDSSSGTVYSYTAKNKNAESPVNVKAVGERWADPPVRYISAGDGTDGEEKCRQYAEYLLLQKTRDSVSEAFTSLYIPHFDVDKVIRYKDGDYVTDSLTVDLSAKTMAVKASSVAFLPTNRSVESYG